MVSSTFTPINYHDTQPWPIEGQLAQLVNDPAHPSALAMLNGYAAQRGASEQDYQGYMKAVNALQLRNINANLLDTRLNAVNNAVDTMGKYPGAATALMTNPYTRSVLDGMDPNPVNQAAFSKLISENYANQGKGTEAFGAAGNVIPEGTVIQPPGAPAPMVGTGFPSVVAASIGGRADQPSKVEQDQTIVQGPKGPTVVAGTNKTTTTSPTALGAHIQPARLPGQQPVQQQQPARPDTPIAPLPKSTTAPSTTVEQSQGPAPVGPAEAATVLGQLKRSPDPNAGAIYQDVMAAGARLMKLPDGTLKAAGVKNPHGYILRPPGGGTSTAAQ